MISEARKNQIFIEAEKYTRNLMKRENKPKNLSDVELIETFLDVTYELKIIKLLEKEGEDPKSSYWQREIDYASDAFADNLNQELLR